MICPRFALLAACAGIAAPLALASPWTQLTGHGQIIFSASYFQTSRQFDGFGHTVSFGSNGYFRQVQLNPYLEYGITSKTTVVVNTFIPLLGFRNDFGRAVSAGWGDTEIGIRHRLTRLESPWVFSLQGTVLFPAYSEKRDPPPGNHNIDLEARLLLGRSYQFSRVKRTVYWGVETAYRYRNGPPGDEVRLDATVGVDVCRRLALMQQFYGIKGLRNGAPASAITNPNAQSDFDLYKLQSSVVLRLNKRIRLQMGWIDTLAGRNTGRGQTALLGIWLDF